MRRFACLSLVASVLGCQQLTRIEGGEQACVPPAVQAAFDRSCARGGCHDANGTGGGLALTAGGSAAVIDGASSQQSLPLVVIGDPQGSYMAHKLVDEPVAPIIGVRMPVAFDPGNAEQSADVGTILAWIAGAPMAGCEDASTSTGDGGVADDAGSSDDGTPVGESSGGDIVASGLPCEVEDLLDRRCRSCHSDPPQGAPMPLESRDHLLAATLSDPSKSVAERALERMMDTAAPMPPAPGTPATAEEIATMQAWIAAGTPAEDCGAGGSESGEPEPDPFDVPPMCSSGQLWNDGDDGDPRMFPGRDCIGCHDDERADDPDDDDIPDLLIAGTIYPTAHEPDSCIGSTGVDLRVVVQSMVSAEEVTLEPNSSGNFLLHRSQAPAGFAAPFQVKVVEGEAERIMPIAAPHGACNRCHTQDGTMDAPGRIVEP